MILTIFTVPERGGESWVARVEELPSIEEHDVDADRAKRKAQAAAYRELAKRLEELPEEYEDEEIEDLCNIRVRDWGGCVAIGGKLYPPDWDARPRFKD